MAAYELLARFKVDGTVAGVHVRNKTTVNGKDYEGDPEPLIGTTDPAYAQFAADFSAAVVSERDSLLLQVAALTTERDAALAQVAPLQARIAELEALLNPPTNPRHVAPFDFIALFTAAELYAVMTSGDPTVIVGRTKLQTIITYVDLDHADTVGLVNHLETTGLIAAGRATRILGGLPPA